MVLSQYIEAELGARPVRPRVGAAGLPAEGAGQRAGPAGRRAIREVAGGGSVVDPKVVESLLGRRTRKRSPLDHLTPREREVLGEIAQGKSNAAVAKSLFLSVRAVEKHINSLFSKLGLSEEHGRPPPGQGGAAVPVRRGRGGLAPPPSRLAGTLGARSPGVRRWNQNVREPRPLVERRRAGPDRRRSGAVPFRRANRRRAGAGLRGRRRGRVGRGGRRPGRRAPPRPRADGHQPARDQRHRGHAAASSTADPDTTVILLSTYTQDDLPADARTCGAAAYVHKEDMSPALLRRIWDERVAS